MSETSSISNEERFLELKFLAGQIFNPHTPVSEKDLFSGRKSQIHRVLDVISQKGLHTIIFGERGVGKSSLANVLEKFFPNGSHFMTTRINCDSTDTFYSVWAKVFDNMKLMSSEQTPGFNPEQKTILYDSSKFIAQGENIPEQVKRALTFISQSINPVIIIDEFDRLTENVRRVFADLIKGLSDYAVQATVILVGVADSVDELINEHQSLSRNLVQIKMPRMDSNEIEEVITSCLSKLGMSIDSSTLGLMKGLCKGLPHYAHLIGLHAARDAAENYSIHIGIDNYKRAIKKAVDGSNQSILSAYHNAVRSTKRDTLFGDILLACAQVDINELGEFAAADLKKPLRKITGKEYEIPAYAKHLNEFSDIKRGHILIKSGTRKRYRYKFRDPLMQPFILMNGQLKD